MLGLRLMYWGAFVATCGAGAAAGSLYGLAAVGLIVVSGANLLMMLVASVKIDERRRCERIKTNWHNQLLRMSAEERAAHVNRFNVFDPREHLDR